MREGTRRPGLRGGHPRRGAGRQLRAPDLTTPGSVVGAERPRWSLALLPEAPAGTIAPRVAGAAEFRATLVWRSPEDVPRGPTLCEPPGPTRCSFTEADDPAAATRRLAGEIKALSEADLGAALGEVLRELTRVAALTEATLEVGALRSVPPRVASPQALHKLARDLREAGLSVRFEVLWTPAAQRADAYLGTGGHDGLHDFLLSHPAWSLT